jgi:cytochrome c-type biogenesis protein CcmF
VSAGILVNASFEQSSYMAALGLVMSFWIIITTIMEIRQRIQPQIASGKMTIVDSLQKLTPSHWGMVSGHLGFAVTLIGIALVSAYNVERNVRMTVGDKVTLQGYEFVFKGVSESAGPNYTADIGYVDVNQNGQKVASLAAEKRFYPVQRNVMTEAGIDSGFTRDLFVALGEQLKNGDWSLRIYVKPFINWIWLGTFIMAFGGILSISDKRYRMAKITVKPKANTSQHSALTEQTL